MPWGDKTYIQRDPRTVFDSVIIWSHWHKYLLKNNNITRIENCGSMNQYHHKLLTKAHFFEIWNHIQSVWISVFQWKCRNLCVFASMFYPPWTTLCQSHHHDLNTEKTWTQLNFKKWGKFWSRFDTIIFLKKEKFNIILVFSIIFSQSVFPQLVS